jgi:hypothetical protein
MRMLIAVAEEGSFSAAARRLGRVQSAVSQAIQTLEENLRLTEFVLADTAQRSCSLSLSRCHQPPSAAPGRSGRSTLKPTLEARRFQDG